MFGHASEPGRNYSYFAREPSEGLDLVRQQMWLAHKYRNKLVEIELARRAAVEKRIAELFPALREFQAACLAVETELETLRGIAKSSNAKARRNTVGEETKALAKALKAALKELRAKRKAARAEAFDSLEWKSAQDQIEAADSAARKLARSECGLYWATYLIIEQAMGSARSGAPPKFMRWTGEGTIAVQVQKGMSIAEAFSGIDQRLRIDELAADAFASGSRVKRRTVVRMRVGSVGRDPVWAAVPIVMHRPMPDDSRIKWAYLHRRRRGTKEEWSVRFALARSEGWTADDRAVSGAVGVDLGWRIVPGGLRVAYWVGDDGRQGQLVLPDSRGEGDWRYLISKAEDLQSIRDGRFDAARAALADWIDGLTTKAAPDWFVEQAKALRIWKSKARLARLIERWRKERFRADYDIFPILDEWHAKERHLEAWELANRRKWERKRRETYRVFAAKLAREYKTLLCEEIDLRKFQRLPEVEEKSEADGAVREHRKDASVSILVQSLKEKFGPDFHGVSAVDTTRRCHACGEIDEFDRANLIHTCGHCGATWDQDFNACRNLLGTASAPVA